LVRKPEGKSLLGRPRIDGRIILECILRKYCGNVWTGFVWLRVGNTGRLL